MLGGDVGGQMPQSAVPGSGGDCHKPSGPRLGPSQHGRYRGCGQMPRTSNVDLPQCLQSLWRLVPQSFPAADHSGSCYRRVEATVVALRLRNDSRQRPCITDVGHDRLNLTRPSGRDGVQIGGTGHRVIHAVHVRTQVHRYHRPASTGQAVDDRCADAAGSPGHDCHAGFVVATHPHATTVGRPGQSRPWPSGAHASTDETTSVTMLHNSRPPSAAEAPAGSPSTPFGDTDATPATRILDSRAGSGSSAPGSALSSRTSSGTRVSASDVSTRPAWESIGAPSACGPGTQAVQPTSRPSTLSWHTAATTAGTLPPWPLTNTHRPAHDPAERTSSTRRCCSASRPMDMVPAKCWCSPLAP